MTGATLDGSDFMGASLVETDLRSASLQDANLQGVPAKDARLDGANLRGAHLDGGQFVQTSWANADLTDASIENAIFSSLAERDTPVSREQIHSTRSYREKNLRGVGLELNLRGWDLSGFDLTGASLLVDASPETNIAGALISRASLRSVTPAQVYSTASYQQRDLSGVTLSLAGGDWDLSGMDLTGAHLTSEVQPTLKIAGANLENAYLSSVIIEDASDSRLVRAVLPVLQSVGARFQRADLEQASLALTTLKQADFSNANLRGTNCFLAIMSDAIFEAANMTAADFLAADLTRASFKNGNLAGARLDKALLSGADFRGANLRNASLRLAGIEGIVQATFDANTVYNQWTQFPESVDPRALGLTLVIDVRGDVDGVPGIAIGDMDDLALFLRTHDILPELFPAGHERFDVDGSGTIDLADLDVWRTEIKATWLGDVNLDGFFNTQDLIQLFVAGEYEDARKGNSLWSTGDWDLDGEFRSSDLVAALAEGGYEAGRRGAAAATSVPESGNGWLALIGVLLSTGVRWRHRRR